MKKIDEHVLADLIRDSLTLEALEMGGVDNWEWYGEALSDLDCEEISDEDLTKDYENI